MLRLGFLGAREPWERTAPVRRILWLTRRVRCPRRNRIRTQSEADITISALTPLPRGAQGLPLHQNLHHEALSTAAAAAIAPAVAGASATADPFVLPDEVLAAMQLPERAAPAANALSFVTARLLRRRAPDLGCAPRFTQYSHLRSSGEPQGLLPVQV